MDSSPFDAETVFQQAMIAYQTGRLDEAETLMRQILAHLPDNDSIMATLGGILLAAGKLPESIATLQRAINLNGANPDAHLNLGIAYQHSGNTDQAIAAINQAAQLAPQRADIQFNLANVLIQLQNYPEAVQKLQEIIGQAPTFLQAYHTLGAVYSYLQNTDAAVQTYEQALAVAPGDLQTLISLGNLLADTGQTQAAKEVYLKATNAHPNHFMSYAVLGKFYLDIGKDHEGEETLKKAYALHPDDLNVNILLGNAHKNFGRIDEAEKLYRRALQISPNNPGALSNLRRILSSKIPYWHFEMLADTQRNDAYQQAIEKAVSQSTKVLDIGTGSGLLAMMAARAGAQQVVACEMHERLAATAQEIVALNGYADQIKVYNKKSAELILGKELPEKVNLIISEILDVGALGEGVLPSIRQAVTNYGTDQVKLIPAGLQLYGQLVEIPGRSIIAPVRTISGFDLSPFEQYRIPDEYFRVILRAEKYRTLSPVVPLMDVDFYQLPPALPEDQPRETLLQFPILEDGQMQAVIFWFDLHLDEEITVSSGPTGDLEHWGQALFCFPNPRAVQAGETIPVRMLQSDMMIRFRC